MPATRDRKQFNTKPEADAFRIKMEGELQTGSYRADAAKGMRDAPLGADVVAALKAWKVRSKYTQPDQQVFPNEHGGYQNHDNMVKRKFFKLFEKLAELHAAAPEQHPTPPARFNWHALRHFAISCWIDAGLSPKTVQAFAGHSSLQMTMDRYGHFFKSDDHRKAMDAIAKQMLGG
jgi:integrase